jgi:O-antigen ligase
MRDIWASRLVVAMTTWAVFAVGAVYAWGAAPLIALAALLAVLAPPKPGSTSETRMLDGCLLASIAAVGLQLVPLPPQVRATVSPHAASLSSALELMPGDVTAWRPIAVSPASTAYAFALVLTALVVFWTTRRCAAHERAGWIVRQIAFAGLAAALVAIVVRARGIPTLIYGIWRPVDEGAHPFGPFVNRNHFATWVLMACPLAAGYIAATFKSARGARRADAVLIAAFEWLGTGAAWVFAAFMVMIISLVLSMSRSGVIALVGTLLGVAAIARGRFTRRTALLSVTAVAAIVAITSAYANTQPLIHRFERIGESGTEGRTLIWRDTVNVIQDFPLTGVGLGGYQTAMLVYQQGDRSRFTNQAHNQYLHLLAEGGLLVSVPAALTIVAFVQLFRKRLAKDRSSTVWLRIGALAAICAVALQGFWETGLRIPANGILFAVAAAVAVHRPVHEGATR